MANGTKMIWTSDSPEIVLQHQVDAPRDLVFRAWTEPSLLGKWWGPHGFTNPVVEVDLRAGGPYHIVMRGRDGTDYPVSGVYREIVKSERLVYTDSFAELPPEWHDRLREHVLGTIDKPLTDSVVTVTFEDHEGGTLLTISSVLDPPEYRDALLGLGMPIGWSQSLERLDALLAEQAAAYRKAA